MAAAVIDARALSKLRWRCRRGLLENDLLIERFFNRYASRLTEDQAHALQVLMDLSDNDLLDLLLGRTVLTGELLHDEIAEVLGMLRQPPDRDDPAGSPSSSLPLPLPGR